MTLRKQEATGNLKQSTSSHAVEDSLWQRLWTWRKADYGLMMVMMMTMMIICRKRKMLLNRIPIFISAAVPNLRVAD